jgi:PAS domain S-box-containing protein
MSRAPSRLGLEHESRSTSVSNTSQIPPRDWRDVPILCGLAVILLGSLVVAGWLLHVPAIVHLWAGMAPMQFNTAVGMVLAGAGLASSRRFSKFESFISVALLALGILTLTEYATGLDLHIDQALFRSWLAGGENPGRVGLNTAACFVLIGITFCLARWFPGKLPLIKLAGSLGVVSIACAALIGYLTGMESVYRWGQATRMAAHTAGGFLVIGLGFGVCGWRALQANRRLWLAGIAWLGLGCVTLMIWAGALGDHHHEMVARSQATAVRVASLATGSFGQTAAALARFNARWEPGCRNLTDVCERDLANYLHDFPAITSLEWVERGTGSVIARRVSPGFKGRDPLETWRPAENQLPVSELIPSPAGSPRLIIAVERPGTAYLAVGIDPSVMFSAAIATLDPGWTVAVSVDSQEVLFRQRRDVEEATYDYAWRGRDWEITASPGAVHSGESHLADWILLAGLTLTCCCTLMAFFWQTSRDRLMEITVFNSNLETRIADRTRDLAAANLTLQSAIEEEHRVSTLLRQREDQMAGVFSAGKIGAWSYTFALNQRIYFGRLNELYGLPPDETPGTLEDFMRRVHPDDRESLRLARERAIAGLTEYRAEYRVIWPDETVHWLGTQGNVTRDANGTPLGMEGINLDITARKESELALQQSEQQIRQLADALPQIVWTATADGNLDYYNQQWCDYTGLTPEQSKNWGWKPVLHPDDLDRCIDRWTRAFTTGEQYEIEYRFKRASDGAYRWHLGRAVPVRNASGEIVRWFGTGTDIEDYKQAEIAIKSLNETLEDRVRQRTAELARANGELEHTKSKLQSVLDAATQVAIIAADAHGVIEVFNSGAERMLQYRADEMVGLHTPAMVHDPDECRERSAELSREFGRPIEGNNVFTELARQGRFDEREWTYCRKDGSKLDVVLAVTAVRNPQGAIEGFLGIATDITTRKLLERDLRLNNAKLEAQTRRAEEANLAKSEFLANMSHEIRTPMNGVLGMTELALETELTPEQREYISTVKISAGSLLTVINDILDFSKIEAGKLELDSTPFHLLEFIEETMKILALRAHQKDLELLFELDNSLPEVIIGDASRIRQILVNLIGNAIKFTERGEVFLKVEGTTSESSPSDVELRFAVRDTGIGIAPERQEKIFLAFAQADGTTTRRFGGTGLGLTISQRLVTMMNGRIWVESEVGKGSTFRFTVSLQVGHSRSREANVGPQGLVGIPVLVVDDNFTNRRILADVLSGWGMRATMAGSGAAALQILKSAREEFPLILTDLQMPEMDGFELAAEIKQFRTAVTIVMLTSVNYAGDVKRCRKLGVEAYLTKPVSRNDLRTAILRALGQQSSSAAVADTVQSGTRSALGITPEVARQSLRVLLAEDNAVNQKVAQLILTKEGHSVVVVSNGLEVLAALEKDCFDVVLMDVQMPEMDGFQATAEIRAAERLKDARMPIVAMTAHAMIGDKEKCLFAGMDDYVAKPIRKAELLGAIQRAIATCHAGPVAPTI